jgi:hypothetical protein
MNGAVIDWIIVDHTDREPVQVGDVVCSDAGGMPAYRVMALDRDRAWLRDDAHPFDWVLPLSSFHWKARRLA